MREFTHLCFKGLGLIWITTLLGHASLQAQIGNAINNGVKTVTAPAKEIKGVAKDVAKPATEINQTTKTISNAPKGVTREYDNAGNEITRAKNEYEKVGDNVDKMAGGDGKKDDKAADKKADDGKSTEKTEEELQHKSAVPPAYVPAQKEEDAPLVLPKKGPDPNDKPRPVPAGSRDNKTPSGPMPASENATPSQNGNTVSTGTPNLRADGRPNPTSTGLSPDTKEPVNSDPDTNASGQDGSQADADNVEAPARYIDLKSVPRSGERRPRPDYSQSPARIPLEKAEFDIETLEDLFRYSNWEGPEREHTVRAVSQSLDDLQQSIVEIKKLDAGQSTWRFEETYRDMKAAFIQEMKTSK